MRNMRINHQINEARRISRRDSINLMTLDQYLQQLPNKIREQEGTDASTAAAIQQALCEEEGSNVNNASGDDCDIDMDQNSIDNHKGVDDGVDDEVNTSMENLNISKRIRKTTSRYGYDY